MLSAVTIAAPTSWPPFRPSPASDGSTDKAQRGHSLRGVSRSEARMRAHAALCLRTWPPTKCPCGALRPEESACPCSRCEKAAEEENVLEFLHTCLRQRAPAVSTSPRAAPRTTDLPGWCGGHAPGKCAGSSTEVGKTEAVDDRKGGEAGVPSLLSTLRLQGWGGARQHLQEVARRRGEAPPRALLPRSSGGLAQRPAGQASGRPSGSPRGRLRLPQTATLPAPDTGRLCAACCPAERLFSASGACRV